MNEKIKARWVKALRSGKYKQGKEALKSPDGYCCLGVLCDLHSKSTRTKWCGNTYLGQKNELPDEVVEWAGLPESNPMLPNVRPQASLAEHNDGDYMADIKPKRFPTIAKLIEKHL